ncbi:MAG: hydroxyacid dehydrogenase [bacterium]
MTTQKILISDPVADVCLSILKDRGFEVDFLPGLPTNELCNKIGAYEGLIVRSATKVTAEVINHAENLKIIGRAGTGVDNIDVAAATQKGIAVVNAAKANTISAAEHTFALMMALARRIPEAQISILKGQWQKSKFIGIELYGKTLGIIGLGKIGRQVAKRAIAFGMHVLACDPLIESEVFHLVGVKECNLNEIFRQSDFITIHVPFADQTRYLVGEAQFEICKRNLRLINTARGGVVDEAALYRALKNGKIAGVALDVFEKEPPGENPLFDLENVVITPHLGAGTLEAQNRVAEEIAQLVANFLLKKSVENIVNPEVTQS